MNILHVGIAYYPAIGYGGPIRSLKALCSGLTARGHHNTVCVTNTDGTRPIDIEANRPHQTPEATAYYFESPKWHYYGYSPKMKEWLRQHVHEYDIVHVSGLWSFPQLYACGAARQRRVPYVISPRGSSQLQLVRQHKRIMKWFFLNIYSRRDWQKAAAIHYTTVQEQQECVIGQRVSRKIVVPNPVSFEPAASVRKKTCSYPYVLFVGRLTWKKKIDILIRAFADVAIRDPELRLLIAGGDDEGLGNGLRQLTRQLGVTGKVEWLGTVSGQDLAHLYEQATVFVMPSIAENFCHSVIEAITAGVPVIVSAGVGISSVGEIAAIVEKCDGSVESVADAIRRVLQNYHEARTKAILNRGVPRKLFAPSVVAEEMEQAYLGCVRRDVPQH